MANASGVAAIARRALADDEILSDSMKPLRERAEFGDRRGGLLAVASGSPNLTDRDPGSGGDLRKRAGQRFRRILVAYDGSLQAERAVETAFSLAGLAAATVLVLAVIKPAEPDDSADFQARLYGARKRYEHSFASMREHASGSEIRLETRISIGRPAEEIVNRAEIMQADLIIMGRHGKSAIRRRILGSNSDRVIENARRPVMIVR